MPSSVRSVEYKVTRITSLRDLLDMMRYEGMRFTCGSEFLEILKPLMERDLGIFQMVDTGKGTMKPVPRDNDFFTVTLVKDQTRHWSPTEGRWLSFGMEISVENTWQQAREVN